MENILKTTTENIEVESVHHAEFKTLVKLLKLRQHVFMVGPAGSGKTHAAEQAARVIGVPFYCQSVGGQTSMTHLVGYMDAVGQYRTTAFRKAFEGGGVYLLDEIDAGNANVLTVLNAALSNKMCSFPDGMIAMSSNFRCAAAGNTYGAGANRQYIGRNALDAATLDRFAFLEWSYDEDMERIIAKNDDWVSNVQAIRSAVLELDIKMVVSPRASIEGAVMLADGFSWKDTEEIRIWKGLDAATRKKIVEKANEKKQKIMEEQIRRQVKKNRKQKIEEGDKVTILPIVKAMLEGREKLTEAEQKHPSSKFPGYRDPSTVKLKAVGTIGTVLGTFDQMFKVGMPDGDFYYYPQRALQCEEQEKPKEGQDGKSDPKQQLKKGDKVRPLPSMKGSTEGPKLDKDGVMVGNIGRTLTVQIEGSAKDGRVKCGDGINPSHWYLPKWLEKVQDGKPEQGEGKGRGQPKDGEGEKAGKSGEQQSAKPMGGAPSDKNSPEHAITAIGIDALIGVRR